MVTIERVMPWDELEQRVRETPLLKQPGQADDETVYPYADANISLEEIAYDEVAPTSLYVVRQNLAVQEAIAGDISLAGFYPLKLEVGLVLRNETGEEIGFVPPIIEETDDEGKYVLDGAHRTGRGRWQGLTHFLGIHVSGIRKDCPAYAFPNSWDDLKVMKEVPPNPNEKKHYRDGNYRRLYRDFSLLNGGRLRET